MTRSTLRHSLCIATVLTCVSTLSAQPRPAADSQRVTGGVRLLQLMQTFSMANTPEMAAAINSVLSDTNAHMTMGPTKHATAADSARAAEIVVAGRAALGKYAEVKAAEAAGYVKFMPWLDNQIIYHYNNVPNIMATMMGGFDVAKPASLLYTKTKGEMRLVGAMYSGGIDPTPDALDARLPLGIAHWHEHVNICGPSPDSVAAGVVKIDGASTARWLKINTREECTAAGGRFAPRLFGWMAHVYFFGSDDPKAIWGGEDKDQMHMHGKP